MSIQHKDIPEAGLHEPKGVSVATVGQVYHADGSGSGEWKIPEVGGSTLSIERLIDAVSEASAQNPTGLGDADAIQIEFGSGVLTGSDPVNLLSDGTLNVNQDGLYRIKLALQFGRTGGAGVSILLFRVLINGVQAGRSVSVKLDDADVEFYFENDNWVNMSTGTAITFEVMRDSSGNNSGGLTQVEPTGSWNTAPTASLRVERFTP